MRQHKHFSGTIFLPNATYVIVPLRGGDLGKRHIHILYKAVIADRLLCANSDHGDWSASSASPRHLRRHRRDARTSPKFIELGIIADYSLAREWEFRFTPMLQYVLEVVNQVDAIWHHQLNTRVALTYVQAWTEANVITFTGDVTQTLLNLIAYNKQQQALQRSEAAADEAHSTISTDANLLLTWHTFERREVTMATAGAMCDGSGSTLPSGVVTCGPKYEPMHTAAIVSHNLAHLVGIRHDEGASDNDSMNTE